MRGRRTVAIPLLLMVASVVASSCIPMTTSTAGNSGVLIPKGWRTYTYGATALSVPKMWVVVHGAVCPPTTSPGTLAFGPAAYVSYGCSPRGPGVEVSVLPLPLGYNLPSSRGYEEASCPPIRINGLRVHVGPCSSSNPAGDIVWTIPSLGIQAVGTGINAYALLNHVLHTIHRRRNPLGTRDARRQPEATMAFPDRWLSSQRDRITQ
jgi:hypothetical protein